jgi:hypothetical protein
MLDFKIDKLTNSIEHVLTGKVFQTELLLTDISMVKTLSKKEWIFDWNKECLTECRLIYRLVASDNPKLVHGLISLGIMQDHVYMHLIETANFNKGKEKKHLGVAGNMVAFACKLGFEKGFDGIVVFESKTRLITHYQLSLGAKILAGNRMFIDSRESLSLVKRYFK